MSTVGKEIIAQGKGLPAHVDVHDVSANKYAHVAAACSDDA
ncbi:MAG: hypothetical protein ACRENE_18835 [Polyangiaceae bacterium]